MGRKWLTTVGSSGFHFEFPDGGRFVGRPRPPTKKDKESLGKPVRGNWYRRFYQPNGAIIEPSQHRAKRQKVRVVVQFDREASQTRGYCVAKNAPHRAARPDPSLRKERLFRMTIKLHHYQGAACQRSDVGTLSPARGSCTSSSSRCLSHVSVVSLPSDALMVSVCRRSDTL